MEGTTLIDFTNCPIDTLSQYGGSDQKRGIFYEGERYMLKFPDRISDDKHNSLNITYSNSIYSEKICCDILQALGFSVQATILGFLHFDNVCKPTIACKNFVPHDSILLSFKSIANSLLPEKLGKVPKLSEVYAVLTMPSSYFSREDCEIALRAYWDLFILDAFLGNFDRHGDNWSYIKSLYGKSIVPSPIYDCGSCLYPQISDEAIPSILQNEDEILMRVDKFPNAALIVSSNLKANYKQYISSFINKDCTEALLRIFPKIDMKTVKAVIEDSPFISDIRKRFYSTMLQVRYNRILKSAFEFYTLTAKDSTGQEELSWDYLIQQSEQKLEGKK